MATGLLLEHLEIVFSPRSLRQLNLPTFRVGFVLTYGAATAAKNWTSSKLASQAHVGREWGVAFLQYVVYNTNMATCTAYNTNRVTYPICYTIRLLTILEGLIFTNLQYNTITQEQVYRPPFCHYWQNQGQK